MVIKLLREFLVGGYSQEFNPKVRDSLVRYIREERDVTCFDGLVPAFDSKTISGVLKDYLVDQLSAAGFHVENISSLSVSLYGVWDKNFHTNYVLMGPSVKEAREMTSREKTEASWPKSFCFRSLKEIEHSGENRTFWN